MALSQTHFRFRTDANAVDAAPTWAAAEDASPSPATTPFRLRLGLNATSAASGEFELYAQKNAGSFAAVTTSATGGIQSYDASSDADDTMLRVPRLSLTSAWWLAGAALDLDFANNRIYPSGAFSDYISCSRASDGYAKNSAGDWVQFTSDQLRITDLGWLIETSRTNYLLNSSSPATQTTQSLDPDVYTLWVEGSGSALVSAGTATITGAATATEGNPDNFSVTGAGTVVVTVTGSLDVFQLEKGTVVSFPTSYIPTAGVIAARAAESVTAIGNLDAALKGSAASVVMDMKYVEVLVNLSMALGDAANQNVFFYIAAGENSQIKSVSGSGGYILTATSGGSTLTGGAKVGQANDGSGHSLVMGGGTVVSDAHPMGTLSTIKFGSTVSGTYYDSLLIKRITVWDSRLADATLQGHTTS